LRHDDVSRASNAQPSVTVDVAEVSSVSVHVAAAASVAVECGELHAART
jgi:hypothetical protein